MDCFGEIKKALMRELTPEELGMLEVMHSEHCSYKSSKPYLKRLISQDPKVLLGPGYDAGVIDIGKGYCLVFKVESHNHPSYIDPYNGAATGVGGIIRDILAMGAKPLAVVDSLHFGITKDGISGNTKWLVKEVVRGIADYGNSTGLPNLGGEIEFDETFETNCLVNVGCIGIVKKEMLFNYDSIKEGDLLLLIGNATGKDGIHGVSFASETIDEQKDMRPAVQIADPFTKKLIIDALEEIYSRRLVKVARDLGGGGLTSATSELAHKLNIGLEIWLEKVHIREALTPYEILLSESQERMLLVIDPNNLKKIETVLNKYTIKYSIIGKVKNREYGLKVFHNEKKVADLDPKLLADVAPVKRKEKERIVEQIAKPQIKIDIEKIQSEIENLLHNKNICSRKYVYEQYDKTVKGCTIIEPSTVAGVFMIDDSLAFSVSCQSNANLCQLEPFWGAYYVMLEAYRSLVSTFTEPLAYSDNLNFGSPERETVMWEFKRTVEGLAEFSKDFSIPCVGGNVSFYNENNLTQKPIAPTPMIMMVGKSEKPTRYENLSYSNRKALCEQKEIILIKTREPLLTASPFYAMHGFREKIRERFRPNLEEELKAKKIILENDSILLANDISKSGMIVSLIELMFEYRFGAEVQLPFQKEKLAEILFGQYYGYIIITEPGIYKELEGKHNCHLLGHTKASGLSIDKTEIDLEKLRNIYETTLEKSLEE